MRPYAERWDEGKESSRPMIAKPFIIAGIVQIGIWVALGLLAAVLVWQVLMATIDIKRRGGKK